MKYLIGALIATRKDEFDQSDLRETCTNIRHIVSVGLVEKVSRLWTHYTNLCRIYRGKYHYVCKRRRSVRTRRDGSTWGQ